MRNTMKRVWMVAAMVLVAGALGACADEPMAVEEEAYTVQMDEEGTDCVLIRGILYCS